MSQQQASLDELISELHELISELHDLIVSVKADQRIAVKIKDAAHMLGYDTTAPVMKLVQKQKLRARRERGSNTTLISVQSLHEYMGDK